MKLTRIICVLLLLASPASAANFFNYGSGQNFFDYNAGANNFFDYSGGNFFNYSGSSPIGSPATRTSSGLNLSLGL